MNSTITRNTPRFLALGAMVASLLTVPVSATAAPEQACVGDEGVTVVVDFTDLGGEVEIGCATGEPENGRDALESAGFTPEDSEPGMICTINNHPDPCPEEFDGNFWSYWSGEDGEWVMYETGADDAEPAPGDVEGWRYADGSEGPTILPTDAQEGTGEAGAEGEDAEETDTDETADTGEAAETDESTSMPIWVGIVIAVAIIASIGAIVARRRNQ